MKIVHIYHRVTEKSTIKLKNKILQLGVIFEIVLSAKNKTLPRFLKLNFLSVKYFLNTHTFNSTDNLHLLKFFVMI